MSAGDRELFGRLRAEGSGEQAVLVENVFVETVLPSGILRGLSGEEHDRYREPFPDAASRAPVLQWVREIPIEGEPADVTQLVLDNQQALCEPGLPTLLLHGDPGALVGQDEIA